MKNLLYLILLLSVFQLNAQEMGLKESKTFSNLGEYVMQAEFSPFRNFFVFTVGNNTIYIYNKNWDKIFEHQGNPKAVGGVFDFSPDEKYLAYGKYKGYSDIAIIRLEDMKVMQVLNLHSTYINRLQFSHDGKYLASASADKKMIVWKVENETFSAVQEFGEFESPVEDVSFSYDDKLLATGDIRGHVLILKRDGEVYVPFQEFQYRAHAVNSIAFNPGKEEFITGSSNGIRRYTLVRNNFMLTDSIERSTNITNPVNWSPDGAYVAYGNYQSAVILKVDEKGFTPMDYVYRHMDNVIGGSFSDDGEFFCTFGSDQQLIIWEIENVNPSDKSLVVSWLKADLSLAQRRALTPSAVSRIIKGSDGALTRPRDEFETTAQYESRKNLLADQSLRLLQEEMEKQYGIRNDGQNVNIPLQSIIGYNADLEIYKIRFMETEAGVSIPIEAARKFKLNWAQSYIRARKTGGSEKSSYVYSDFRLLNSADKTFYVVTPVENPFNPGTENGSSRVSGTPSPASEEVSDHYEGTTYALMFATNVYDYFDDLINPVLDAQTIAAELEESYGVQCELIINPTLSETASRIREFASRDYGPDDNLLVFFAGHGIYDEVFREGYVISKDSRMNDPGKTSYLSHSNLRTMINNIDCNHIFLVMDVCFGGTFDPHLASSHRGTGIYGDIPVEEFVQRKMKYKTRLYLTSGGKEYVPDGRPGFHSPFARRFIESLRYYGGDDGVLTTAEILQFVEKVNPQPRFGEFGDNEPGSDFILVLKN